MIDIFTVLVPHVLMALAIWRLLARDELDFDPILPGTAEALERVKRGFAKTANGARGRKDAQADRKAPRA
jgi:hypothetical protein